MTNTFKERLAEHGFDAENGTLRPNLDGYYIHFAPTGNPGVDNILEAIAFAGKAYHGTNDWGEDLDGYAGIKGLSCMDIIQMAAQALADDLRIASDPKIETALVDAFSYGQIDGDHHKAWVIDQMVRALTGDAYADFVREYEDGEDGPETYDWNEGTAP